MINRLYNYLVIIFILGLCVAHVMKHKEYDALFQENQKLKQELEAAQAKPIWLENAYVKCTEFDTKEDFVRACIAFEIKDLHH